MLKVLLIGQPNVGKSSLLNALVGPKVVVSNYPGTTVEVTQAEKVFKNTKINFVDTPGIYSISDRSEEEKVTEKALFEEKADGAVVIVDATSLERSLYMALQILEARIPTILTINFIEEAEKKGIKIDFKKLGKILNVPVVPINPITKKGIDKLLDVILKIKKTRKRTFKIGYDDDIEKAINKIYSQIKGKLPRRFVALRVLEGDEDFYKYLKGEKVTEKFAKDISIARYGTASFISEKVTFTPLDSEHLTGRVMHLKKEEKLEENVDNVLLHKIWGPVTTGLSLFAIFGLLLYLGNLIQGFLMGLAENILSSFNLGNSIITIILTQGLTGVVAGISIALPYVFLFYLFLGLLEDIGLLSRFIVNAESFLKKLGLSGKSFIPLSLGLGCTVPAVRATRVLSSKKRQFHTASLFAFVPCSSRMAIIMGIVGFYGGINLSLSVFATAFVAGLLWAFGIKKILHLKSEPLLLELPPYRRPLVKNVLAKSWIRMKDFVYIVIPLLAIGGIGYGVLNVLNLINIIVEPFLGVTRWLGLPAVTIVPIVFGFLQKDLTGAMLFSVLGSNIALTLTNLQIYTFGVTTTIGIPCIIALGMLIKEFGIKKAVLLTIGSILYGLVVAGLAWRIISIF